MGILYVFVFLFLAVGLFNMAMSVYAWFDHSQWRAPDSPDPDACITGLRSEKVTYTKNNAKFMTTVSFSDGFRFITHDTNREDKLLSYSISVTPEMKKWILQKAILAHDKAVQKRVPGAQKTRETVINLQTAPVVSRQAAGGYGGNAARSQKPARSTWICSSCGAENALGTYQCKSCGKNKA